MTGQPIGTRISHQDLMTYLNNDSANALRDARRLYSGVFDRLPSEVQHIIADMMFNLGYSRLSRLDTENLNLNRVQFFLSCQISCSPGSGT